MHVEVGVLAEAVGLGVVLVVQVVPPAGRQPLRGEKRNMGNSNRSNIKDHISVCCNFLTGDPAWI